MPLERALNGTPGMISMRTESLFGLSLVYLTFDDDVDAFKARTLVTERLADRRPAARASTPSSRPSTRRSARSTSTGSTSDRHDLHELRSEQEWMVARSSAPGARASPTCVRVRRLPEGGPRRGRPGAPARARPDAAGRQRRRSRKSNVERRRRLPAPRRSGAGDARRRLPRAREDSQNVVLEARHGTPVTVGDVARVLLSQHAAARRASARRQARDRRGLRAAAPRREPDARARRRPRQGRRAQRQDPAAGHEDRAVLRPHRRWSSHTLGTVHHNLLFGGSCSSSRGLAVPAHASAAR